MQKTQKQKAVYTHSRMLWHIYFWRKLQRRLRHHLNISPKGEQTRMARAIGISDAQLHRLRDKCGCDHTQEPNFSIGMAIMLYLESYLFRKPTITLDVNHPSVTVTRKRRNKRN